ncbi:hypothetical protein niasHT_017451 [Heterodera trifolii]|uniref:Uncharacterized protein n=1 Tax=Heterodera trifolii TaxID=157864 RepID=A0ABD2LF59_9BILA
MVKIVLLKAFKYFNWQAEKCDENEMKIITENFVNFENCAKVIKLSKAFQKKKTLEIPIGNTMDRYRKALEKIKIKMEEDDDYCIKCKIPTVDEIMNGKESKLKDRVEDAFQKAARKAKKIEKKAQEIWKDEKTKQMWNDLKAMKLDEKMVKKLWNDEKVEKLKIWKKKNKN